MAYRPEWFPKENKNCCYDIMPIAQRVVDYIRGSYDCMPEHHELNVRALKWVIENWDDSYDCGKIGDAQYDLAVFNVIRASLKMEEINKELNK